MHAENVEGTAAAVKHADAKMRESDSTILSVEATTIGEDKHRIKNSCGLDRICEPLHEPNFAEQHKIADPKLVDSRKAVPLNDLHLEIFSACPVSSSSSSQTQPGPRHGRNKIEPFQSSEDVEVLRRSLGKFRPR